MNIRNFVNINIEKLQKVSESGSRPHVIVYNTPAAENSEGGNISIYGTNSSYSKYYDAEGEEINNLTDEQKDYSKIFFANGGVELEFSTKNLDDFIKQEKENKDNVIFVRFSKEGEKSLPDTSTLDNLKGVYQKILIVRIKPDSIENIKNKNTSSFVAIKVSSTIGAEMTIAAYLSKMKCYEEIADYDFTEEYQLKEDLSDLKYIEGGNPYNTVGNDKTIATEESTEGSIQYIAYNFEMKVGNKYLNIGGNTVDGNSLVEQFVTIVLTQTVTEKVFNALSTKLVGQSGLAAIRTAMAAELDRYVTSGFLTTTKVWMEPNLIVTNKVRPDETETVITKNTPLSSGYYIHLFKLSEDGRRVYAFILLPTTKGIRYVEVDGRTM